MNSMGTFHGILSHINGQYVHISWYSHSYKLTIVMYTFNGILIHRNGLYVNVENLSLFAISSEYVFVAGSSDCHFILEKDCL